MDRDYISTRDAGHVLGISPTAVVRLIQRGTLGAQRVGLSYLLKRSSVEALANDPDYRQRSRSGARRLTTRRAKLEALGQLSIDLGIPMPEKLRQELEDGTSD